MAEILVQFSDPLVTSDGTTRPELLCGGRTTGVATGWYSMDIIAQPAGELVRHSG